MPISNGHSEYVASSSSSARASSSSIRFPIEKKDAAFYRKVKAKEKARQATMAKTGEEPIYFDIVELLGADKVKEIMTTDGGGGEWVNRFPRDTILQGKVERLNAHGVGLIVADTQDWILAVPNVLPGEVVKVRVDRNERLHSKCDLLEVIEKSAERREDLIGCKYFGECPGCQYQMLPYEKQLLIKQQVVTNAFLHFSGLDKALLPETLPTLPSPLQYAYRTKLTPHFELPRSLGDFRRKNQPDKMRRKGGRGISKFKKEGKSEVEELDIDEDEMKSLTQQWSKDTDIGFDQLKGGGRGILDIEECPIGTAAINKALPIEKQKVKDSINTFRAGATLLLRDSITQANFGPCEPSTSTAIAKLSADPPTRDGLPIPATVHGSEVVTSYRAVVREKVEDVRFETPSGSFFQNNRSILPALVGYVREAILAARGPGDEAGPSYLVDTYCGSGLFALLLAPLFTKVAGVEISIESIEFAKRNAELNGLSDKVEFLAGKAEEIFSSIQDRFEREKTTVVIDPPRRGCDEAFIDQLVHLGPNIIVYVSCNVHTQARDVGQFLRKSPRYEISSIRG